MKIDIDKLSEKELIDLNHRIVERLKFLAHIKSHSKMMEFGIGEKISFHASENEIKFGVITKYNKKTVTIITENGERWNVSPHLLNKVKETKGTVIKMNQKNNKIS